MSEALISLRGIHKTYDGVVPVEALKPVDLDIFAGDLMSVTGPSGSGKSTFMNVLGLLDRPSGGSYFFNRENLAQAKDALRISYRGHRIGFVFQAFHLLAQRTALENVEIGQLYTHPKRSERLRAATEALDMVGLGHRVHARPGELSGGEKQRVAIARAISSRPSVLLCDEPTGNLDSVNAAKVRDLLFSLSDQGLTVIIVTHDSDLASRTRRQVQVQDGLLSCEN